MFALPLAEYPPTAVVIGLEEGQSLLGENHGHSVQDVCIQSKLRTFEIILLIVRPICQECKMQGAANLPHAC